MGKIDINWATDNTNESDLERYDIVAQIDSYSWWLARKAFGDEEEMDTIMFGDLDDLDGIDGLLNDICRLAEHDKITFDAHRFARKLLRDKLHDLLASTSKYLHTTIQKYTLLDGLAEVIVNNSGIECDEDDAPVFPDVASVSVDGKSISVTMNDGSVYDITVS
jgi:hypothetical protein